MRKRKISWQKDNGINLIRRFIGGDKTAVDEQSQRCNFFCEWYPTMHSHRQTSTPPRSGCESKQNVRRRCFMKSDRQKTVVKKFRERGIGGYRVVSGT